MKRHLLLITLALLLAGSVNANTIGVYWDEAGTVSQNNGIGFTFTGYVIIFVEDVVTGTAFQLQLDGDIAPLTITYPDGLQIGDAYAGGVEIGMSNAQYGFLGTPVLVATMQFLNTSTDPSGVAHATVDIVPHSTYMDIIYTDGSGAIAAAPLAGGAGNTGFQAIANEDMTFGGVKNLFR